MHVLLIDDHALFRQGLQLILSTLDERLRFSDAADCASVLRDPALRDVNVVLLDLGLPDGNALASIEPLRAHCTSAAIVVVSGIDDPQTVRRAIDAGAAGFVPKSSSSAVLIAALRLILTGGIYLPPHVLDPYGGSGAAGGAGRSTELLSARQQEVLLRAIQGTPNKNIALALGISEGTVKAHLSAAYRVLGVPNRTSAVYAAARLGLTLRGRE